MTADRRKSRRDTPDRRKESRSQLPVWGYALAILALGGLLLLFWSMIY